MTTNTEPQNSDRAAQERATAIAEFQRRDKWRRRIPLLPALLFTIVVMFSLKGETIVLTAARSTVDLDPSEVKDIILQIGYYADVYDDELVNEFGGKRHADAG